MAVDTSSFLSVKNLSKTYHRGNLNVQALKDISLEIKKGEFTAIVGPSGSGKTTLLNCIGCIDRADSGIISLEGKDIRGKPSGELARIRREHFGFIFQTYNLIPVLNVYENIELPLKLLRIYQEREIKEKIMSMLDEVGLQGLESRMPGELSGGQQQRVSIARALIKRPGLVLADEPTANLDTATGEAIVDLMKSLNKKEKTTFIFSTHDRLIMKHARRLIEIRDGMIHGKERS